MFVSCKFTAKRNEYIEMLMHIDVWGMSGRNRNCSCVGNDEVKLVLELRHCALLRMSKSTLFIPCES